MSRQITRISIFILLSAFIVTVSSPMTHVAIAADALRVPPALAPKPNVLVPTQTVAGTFDFSKITADKVLVIDPESRQAVVAKKEREQHPLASLTKLMTALIAHEHGLTMNNAATVLAEDEVGGARLRVNNGAKLTVRDIFYAMIVGSANNAAQALARMTGKPVPDFVEEMNERARTLGLDATTFSDTSGLDLGNVSTAQDIAALALTAFDDPVIRSAASTAYYPLQAEGILRQMKNTNGLLTDPNNGLYVLGGKTGYLIESKWNIVVKMRDHRNRPLLIVVLGSASDADAFKDATLLGQWVWTHFQWRKPLTSVPKTATSPTQPHVPIGLYRGMRSAAITLVQKKLTAHYGVPADTKNVTGYFGPKTEELVKRFQLDKKLISSANARDAGYIGPKTSAALNLLD